ncbi:GNAT family N-acetyltransferase [Catenulispora yoronensis]|uniref:GNAT family N-acetyltransferase n=1 Tax=Catenulispora yoronensis TaxID=450799 RepID=A0ABP5F865_9ACTN
MQITIREALPQDLAAAGDLTATAYQVDALAEPTYLPRLRDTAARHAAEGTWQLVAVDEAGTVVGAAVYTVAGSEFADIARGVEAEIRMLATAHAARGRGVGEALVRHCADRARAEDRGALVLSTKPQMAAAQRLYERLGFQRIPERDWEYAPGKALLTFLLPVV